MKAIDTEAALDRFSKRADTELGESQLAKIGRRWTLRERVQMNALRQKNKRKAKRNRRHWDRVNDRRVRV